MVVQPGLDTTLSSWRSSCPHRWHQYLIVLRQGGSWHPQQRTNACSNLRTRAARRCACSSMAKGLPAWVWCAIRSGVAHDCDHSHMRILVATQPIDFRSGIDALAGACKYRLHDDPFNGTLFVFGNRARTAHQDTGLRWTRVLVMPKAAIKRMLLLLARRLPAHLHSGHLWIAGAAYGGDPTRTNAAPLWRALGSTKSAAIVSQPGLSN